MKHFIVKLHYIKSIEEIDNLLIEHREFLDTGYQKKILLTSGPQNPRDGGILIARSTTLEKLKDFCAQDPFLIHGCAEYTYTEFIPVKYQSEFSNWFIPEG
ncbi:MAG: YciI family protein [Leptospiraceae bacterium]|nr:YciI family protein [Leptospiraceae bacterium]